MTITYVSHTRCTICGKRYDLDEVQYTCPVCGPVGTLDIRYDYERLRAEVCPEQIAAQQDYTMWRYRPLLPVTDDAFIPPLSVGWTPLAPASRLGDLLGI